MTNITYKSPLGVLLLVTTSLLAVVGRHAATAQGVNLQSCFINCRLRVISCATGCRIGAGPFPLTIRFCLGQCGLQNLQCLQTCTNPSPISRRPPRRPILPPIFHRPPHRPILPPIFHRPPHRPILPPIFHRPPSSPYIPPIPPISPILPKAPHPVSSQPKLSSRPPPLPPTSTLDPLPSSTKSSSISAFTLPLPPPPAQVDHFGKGT